jgi:transcriptional regulator with XRE-family HTH domain
VSRQQLVKYERAKDRIGASRLYLVASTLGVPVDYSFAGLPDKRTCDRKFENWCSRGPDSARRTIDQSRSVIPVSMSGSIMPVTQ